MTFRDALEREISIQGISVAEVVQKSKVSKGTIYNILNGTTEEARIRAATRRAIARGCDRDIEVLPDGGVIFVDPGQGRLANSSEMVQVSLTPFCPFRSEAHLPEPFDWLHAQEESGRLTGLKTVDRVFQRREDFLELTLSNLGDLDIVKVDFTLHVVFDNGVVGDISCVVHRLIKPAQTLRHTVFLMGGPGYHLTFSQATYTDEDDQSWQISQVPNYRFEGDLT
jgi:transcriptional regulator with XRE-family HTH domain